MTCMGLLHLWSSEVGTFSVFLWFPWPQWSQANYIISAPSWECIWCCHERGGPLIGQPQSGCWSFHCPLYFKRKETADCTPLCSLHLTQLSTGLRGLVFCLDVPTPLSCGFPSLHRYGEDSERFSDLEATSVTIRGRCETWIQTLGAWHRLTIVRGKGRSRPLIRSNCNRRRRGFKIELSWTSSTKTVKFTAQKQGCDWAGE